MASRLCRWYVARPASVEFSVNEAIFSESAIVPKQTGALVQRRVRLMERDMNTAIARYLARSSEKTTSSFDGLVAVAIFSGVGLLISLSVLLLDRYIPVDWF